MIRQLYSFGLDKNGRCSAIGRAFELALGALGALGFAPFYFAPVTLLVFALLILRLFYIRQVTNGPRKKTAFWTSFFIGFGFFLAGLYWIGAAFTMRPGYLLLMPPLVGGLIAVLSSFWGAAGAIMLRSSSEEKSPFVTFAIQTACLLFVAEWLRGHVLGGLPWNLPAYIVEAGTPLSQVASLIGVYGQSLIILLLAASLACGLASSNLKQSAKPLSVIAISVIALWGFGTLRLNNAEPISYHPDAKLRLVTVDFDQRDKNDPEKAHKVIEEFIRQSIAPGIEEITHVVWPEGAVDGFVLEDNDLVYTMGQALTAHNPQNPPSWIFNTIRRDINPTNQAFYSSIIEVTFDASGAPTLSSYNDKTKLVPFGEYVPFHKFFASFGIESLTRNVASFTAAENKEPMKITGLPDVNALVCYEGIFPSVSRKIGDKSAWSLNLSNDGWYGKGTGPYQHVNQNRYRAIEMGRPFIRSSAGGKTGVYNQHGQVVLEEKSHVTGNLDVSLPSQVTNHVKFFQFSPLWLLISLFIYVLQRYVRVIPARSDYIGGRG